jgi:hypothetical protein
MKQISKFCWQPFGLASHNVHEDSNQNILKEVHVFCKHMFFSLYKHLDIQVIKEGTVWREVLVEN